MSIARTDLNLLKVFEAVYEERNLLLAGRRLNLTQSAVSHALRRLRELVGDEIFIRTGKGMIPTRRAAAMAPALRDSLRRIKVALDAAPFSPEKTSRRFVIAANDHVTAVMVAPLSRELQKTAPGVDLAIRPSARQDLAEQIDSNRVDLAIGVFSQVPPRLNSRLLMSQGEAILMTKGHPAARRKLTLNDLTKYPLVTLSVGGEEESAEGGVIVERGLVRESEMFNRRALEEALLESKKPPRQRMTVPHALAVPALLHETQMLAIVPTSLAVSLARSADLLYRQTPYKTGTSTMRAVWHSRDEHDAGHAWLRGLVARTASSVEKSLE